MTNVDTTKKCSKCEKTKPVSEFLRRGDGHAGLRSQCRSCRNDIHRQWRSGKVIHLRKTKRDRVLLALAFVDAAKADGCVDCGEKDVRVLDLDHVRGNKVQNVSLMLAGSLSKLFAEIDKCVTRCANCHRRITATRRQAVGA